MFGSIFKLCNNLWGEKTHRGYYWEYSNEKDKPEEKNNSVLIAFLEATNILTKDKIAYKTLKELKKNGFRIDRIKECLSGKIKTHKGFMWKLLDKDFIFPTQPISKEVLRINPETRRNKKIYKFNIRQKRWF